MSLYVLSELRLAQSKRYLIWQFFRVTSGGARVGGNKIYSWAHRLIISGPWDEVELSFSLGTKPALLSLGFKDKVGEAVQYQMQRALTGAGALAPSRTSCWVEGEGHAPFISSPSRLKWAPSCPRGAHT